MYRVLMYRLVVGMLCVNLWWIGGVNAASIEQQRRWFLAAEQAIRDGEYRHYQALRGKLKDYPLLPYLELADLKSRLREVNPIEIADFLRRYQDEPVADMLRRRWLDYLAREEAWSTYLAFYTEQSSITRQCRRLQALIETGQRRRAWRDVEKIWLHGESRPSACDVVFEAWRQADKLTPTLVWRRIELAMEAGQWRLARYLGKYLDQQDGVWLQHWIRLYQNPRDLRHGQAFSSPHPYREIVLSHLVRRMAALAGMEALEIWHSIASLYPFSKALRYRTERRIALALETHPDEQAYRFITGLTVKKTDQRLHIARLRAALLRQDWSQLLHDLAQWPDIEKREERWRYWYARALDGMGKTRQAQAVWRRLARERSFYGFMAADRTKLDYHLAHADTPTTWRARRSVSRLPGIRRALEWHGLQQDVKARREWRYATRDLNRVQLKAAAILAEQKGWHDQAIFTLARTEYWDDLALRFPLSHRELVYQQAFKHQLDPSFIFAIIRQESAFMRDARSHVGALGLMQLMPTTAKQVARQHLRGGLRHQKALLKAETNIALGAAYLRQLMDRFDNNPVLAAAAYNAGSRRVTEWLPDQRTSADIWIELVPFKETADYLRRVMAYRVIYDKRLGRQPLRLVQQMQSVDNPQMLLASSQTDVKNP